MEAIARLIVIALYSACLVWFGFKASDAGAYVPRETIPRLAYRYRGDLIRNSRFVFGLQAPTSTFGAQVHAESTWNPNAHDTTSTASGLAQFTKGTARWMARRHSDLAPAAPLSPVWSLRALVRYDWELYQMTPRGTLCQKMRYTLIGFNYGPGRMYRTRLPRETKFYIHRILVQLEPIYAAAGFGPAACAKP